MDKSGAKFKFVGHSTEIIRQSKNKGTLIWIENGTKARIMVIDSVQFDDYLIILKRFIKLWKASSFYFHIPPISTNYHSKLK